MESQPQIHVSTNNITATCENNCSVAFVMHTLSVDSVSPSTANKGDILTLSGAGFTSDTEVLLGGVACNTLPGRVTDNTLECQVGAIPGGNHHVHVRDPVKGLGDVSATATVNASLQVTSIYPTKGSLQGGTIVTISGHGFAARGVLNTVHIGMLSHATGHD